MSEQIQQIETKPYGGTSVVIFGLMGLFNKPREGLPNFMDDPRTPEELRRLYFEQQKAMERERYLNTALVAQLYADVFKDPPWNENTKCPTTGNFFGLETRVGDPCLCCNKPLAKAYPLKSTIAYIESEMDKPDAIMAVQTDPSDPNEDIVGFTWGYRIGDSRAFAKSKYKMPTMQEAVIASLPSGPLYYFSECGVSPNYRNRGLSNNLAQIIVKQAETLNLPLVMRTNRESPMVSVAKRFGMKQINPLPDTENPMRVLFIR